MVRKVNGEFKLIVLENMVIDTALPKFKGQPQTQVRGGINPSVSWGDVDSDFSGTVNGITVNGVPLIPLEKKSFKERVKNAFKKKEKAVEVLEPIKMTVQEFFFNLKNSTDEILEITARADSYELALEQAKSFGQQALIEKLEKNINIIKQETQLYVMGLKTILREPQIIEFAEKVEKGVKLTYIRNYTRIIPEDLLEIKKQIDEKGIFDNYVIMHYDPHNEHIDLTEEEKIEKAKDPIMFGLIENSRKLYYIGDWVDEYCDLTLEAIIDTLGDDAVKANNITLDIKTNL